MVFCSIPDVALAFTFLLALLGLTGLAEVDDIRLISSVLSARGEEELAGPPAPLRLSPASPKLKRELLKGESVRSAPPLAENEPKKSRSLSARRLLLLEPRVPIPLELNQFHYWSVLGRMEMWLRFVRN